MDTPVPAPRLTLEDLECHDDACPYGHRWQGDKASPDARKYHSPMTYEIIERHRLEQVKP